ncbi:hypothetical protein KGQ71_00580 [Patescibacteria group bacterium]|nr:hypothetical protein [Patescibacteria group bacterium]
MALSSFREDIMPLNQHPEQSAQMMEIRILPTPEMVGESAAGIIAHQIVHKPDPVIGFATGRTPTDTYRILQALYGDGMLSFRRIQDLRIFLKHDYGRCR